MRDRASFIGWAFVAIALAVGAFLLVWTQIEEPIRGARMAAREVAAKKSQAQPEPQAPARPAEPVSARVLFAFDQAALQSAERLKLALLVEKISGAAFERIDAIGHADRIGTEAYNLALSQRRAEAVKAYLVSRGLDPGAVRTYAKGESEPVTDDGCVDMGPETAANSGLVACLQLDRRVNVAVVGWR
jgi:OOP family OmpA-OmpF porin